MSEQRIAVITGAARGIGLEVARQLFERDIAVVLTARTQDGVRQALDELDAKGDAEGHVLDVADEGSVDAFFDWFWSSHDRLDILVNNAGRIYGGWGRSGVSDVPAEAILEAVDNNALSAYRMIQHALPEMNRHGFGRIVNVSSGMGALNEMNGNSIAYRVSKTAMNAITRVTHAEAGDNVKVNSVCPGWVRTDMGGANASRPVSQGAAGVVWAATLADDGPSGGFFRDGKPIDW